MGLPLFLYPSKIIPIRIGSYLANVGLPACMLTCQTVLSFLLLTIFDKLSVLPIHPSICDSYSKFTKFDFPRLYNTTSLAIKTRTHRAASEVLVPGRSPKIEGRQITNVRD